MKNAQLALHGLAIKKHGNAAEVAQITGLDESTVQAVLDETVEAGRAVKLGEKYLLRPAAQVALKTSYSRDFAEQRSDDNMHAAYQAFESINEQLKQLMTDWQTVTIDGESLPNDHSDPDYDNKIIDRLGDLHERVVPILDRFATVLPRLTIYKTLLTGALEKAEDGDTNWVADAKCMSYHTVWFELHEDLIRILGLARVE
jgi:hypothetical protein